MRGISRQLKNSIILGSILFLLSSSNVALSAEDPVKMLKDITQHVLTELKVNYQEIKHEPEKVYSFVNSLVLPHVDFVEMARWVVGRNVWHKASNEARKAFIEEFKMFITKNYTKLLLKCIHEEIEFFPLREDWKNQRHIQVSSFIKKGNYSSTRMDYQLILQDNKWKVYDILIEGASLLEGYQAQFSEDVQRGGIDTLIEKIRKQNAR